MLTRTPSRKKNKRIGDTGRRAENRLSKRLGGRLTPASGAMQGAKGDIKKGDFLIEAKATETDTYRVDYGVLRKIKGESMRGGKNAALAVTFVTGDGRPREDGSWVMIPESLFKELIGE